jgi:hypothetical protein
MVVAGSIPASGSIPGIILIATPKVVCGALDMRLKLRG